MNVFNIIKSNIYDPSFYKSLKEKPINYSIKYFFSLIVVLVLLSTIITSLRILPEVNSVLDTIKSKVVEYYPADLEISIKDGVASTNVAEPYFVVSPDSLKKTSNTPTRILPYNMLVIDTENDFSLATFRNDSTFALLTKDSLIYEDNRTGKVTIMPLRGVPDMTITADSISGFVEKIRPFVQVLIFFIPLLMFFGGIAAKSFFLIYMFFGGFVVWCIAKVKKVDLGYWKAYQVAIHASTLSIIANWMAYQLGMFPISCLFTILLAVIAGVNLKSSSAEPSVA
jgi:hypothetical protein